MLIPYTAMTIAQSDCSFKEEKGNNSAMGEKNQILWGVYGFYEESYGVFICSSVV